MDQYSRAGASRTLPRRPSPRFSAKRRRSINWPCPQPSVFSVLLVYEHHDVVLQLDGELDIAGRAALEDCIVKSLSDGPRRLVFELSALEFVDVFGAHAFRDARLGAESAGIDFVLDSPNPAVRQVLDWCGVLEGAQVR